MEKPGNETEKNSQVRQEGNRRVRVAPLGNSVSKSVAGAGG